jgi:hypothetical protein
MYTTTYHHPVHLSDVQSYIWEENTTSPFNELILSWNIKPTDNQDYKLEIQVKIEGVWTPWSTYAQWSLERRSSFKTKLDNYSLYIDQDQIKILNDKLADGFKIKVSGQLNTITLSACISRPEKLTLDITQNLQASVFHPIPHLHQFSLPHERSDTMCSPTSLTSVLRYLLKTSIDPLETAERVRDQEHDIYGNWVFNVAHAYTLLHNPLHCWVERLASFSRVHQLLLKGYPLVISIKYAREDEDGHLIGLVGYNAATQEVLCMDPAKKEYPVRYSLKQLSEHWGYRQYIAYIFSPVKSL